MRIFYGRLNNGGYAENINFFFFLFLVGGFDYGLKIMRCLLDQLVLASSALEASYFLILKSKK